MLCKGIDVSNGFATLYTPRVNTRCHNWRGKEEEQERVCACVRACVRACVCVCVCVCV